MEQYFSNNPTSKDVQSTFEYDLDDFHFKFKFTTNNGVFSKNAVDFGTNLMLTTFISENEKIDGNILDAGCGLGVVGVVLGKVFPDANIVMFDINERAVELSKKNIKANGVKNAKVICSDLFEKVEGSFDYILSNPPIRAGKKVIFDLYKDAFDGLTSGGALYVVIQKKQGAESSEKKLNEIFNNCQVITKKAGYRILKSIKS